MEEGKKINPCFLSVEKIFVEEIKRPEREHGRYVEFVWIAQD